jgi:hypothetical protein
MVTYGAGENLCTQLLGAQLKFVQIGLPTLALGGLERNPNLDFRFLLRLDKARNNRDENEQPADDRQPNPHKDLQAGATLHTEQRPAALSVAMVGMGMYRINLLS